LFARGIICLIIFRDREEKEVWDDSEEAKAWLARRPERASSAAESDAKTPRTDASASATTVESSQSPIPSRTPGGTPPTNVKPATGPKRPVRRKGNLESLAASLQKPKKINTLEKSKLDWDK
jgi:hypothetical protein